MVTIEDFEQYSGKNRAELIADAVIEADTLAHALAIQRDPDTLLETYGIDLTDKNAVLPPELTANLLPTSTIEGASISIEQNNLTGISSFQLILNLTGEVDSTILLSPVVVKNITFYEVHQVFSDGEPLPMPASVSLESINIFIASIVAQNKKSDYAHFKTMDLSDSNIARNIGSALDEYSDYHTSTSDYFTHGESGLTASRVSVATEDGTVVKVDVQRSLHKGAVTISFKIQESCSEHDDDIDMGSLEGLRSYNIDIDGLSEPRPVDESLLIAMHDFMKEIDVGQLPSINQLDDSTEDPTSSVNIEDLRDSN